MENQDAKPHPKSGVPAPLASPQDEVVKVLERILRNGEPGGYMSYIEEELEMARSQAPKEGEGQEKEASREEGEPEDGEKCRAEGCDGLYEFRKDPRCFCHLSPPCPYCVPMPVECAKCGDDGHVEALEAESSTPAEASEAEPESLYDIGIMQTKTAFPMHEVEAPKPDTLRSAFLAGAQFGMEGAFCSVHSCGPSQEETASAADNHVRAALAVSRSPAPTDAHFCPALGFVDHMKKSDCHLCTPKGEGSDKTQGAA
jgi:hypothetical protein